MSTREWKIGDSIQDKINLICKIDSIDHKKIEEVKLTWNNGKSSVRYTAKCIDEYLTTGIWKLIPSEPVNDKWYVRCIDDVRSGLNKLIEGNEYEIVREVALNKPGYVIINNGKEEEYYQSRFTPKHQKQQAMNTDINEQIVALEKQINELKEQVSNPYKVDDWVYIHDSACGIPEGTVAQLENYDGNDWWLKVEGCKCANAKRFRKATQVEIAAAQVQPKEKVVEIGSERTKITVKKGQIIGPDKKIVDIDAVKYLHRELKDAAETVYIPWTISEISCKIGCAEKVTIAQLKLVIDEYDKINKL